MNDSLAADLLGRLGGGLSQHARLITLETALPLALVAESLVAQEAVNALFSIEVEALSGSASVDVTQLLGDELTVTLLQPDHSRRAWHGICTEAEQVGADGGMARYRLLLEPALQALRLRRDSYIFQNKDVRAVVMELLADYPLVRCEFDVSAALPVRPICTQYEESDFAFFTRVLAADGLSWRFEHGPVGGEHKVVIFDAGAVAPVLAGGAVLRFHGVRAVDSDDAIDRFGARREMMANAVAVSSWDPAGLIAPAAEWRSSLDAGELPELSIYEGSGERLLADAGHADARGEAMLKALELENKTFEGAGAVRRLAAGCRFTLSQHDRFGYGSDEFTVLAVRHEARNNFQPGLWSARGVEAGTYRNSFTCVRSSVALVPTAAVALRAPSAPGPQTALVVGMANSVATTNRDHQVLVQFGWQRGTRPNDGGLAHDLDADGCAPGNDASGTWVRVAEALAGPNWGSVFTPRIGTETLVDFVDGDVDRPVVVGQLYNGVDRPPFPAGEDSGANHPGVLSGIHARGFDGVGYAQWVVDDSAGQLRMRLASSCADTQLNLGYLLEQGAESAQRGECRGSGFELKTDAWAAIRGGEGVFLTSTSHVSHACGVESTHMDAEEASAAHGRAQRLNDEMGGIAEASGVASSNATSTPKSLCKIIGRTDTKNSPRTNAAALPERFGSPAIVLDSTACIAMATPASTVVNSGTSLHWAAQTDVQYSVGATLSSVSGGATNLFSDRNGANIVAVKDQVSLEAHTYKLSVTADKEIVVISTSEVIRISAKNKIVLQAGEAAITLSGDSVSITCPGKFSAKGASHAFDKGAQQCALLNKLADSRAAVYDEGFRLIDKETGMPLSSLPYRIIRRDGSEELGITDEDGRTHVVTSADIEDLTLELPSQEVRPS